MENYLKVKYYSYHSQVIFKYMLGVSVYYRYAEHESILLPFQKAMHWYLGIWACELFSAFYIHIICFFANKCQLWLNTSAKVLIMLRYTSINHFFTFHDIIHNPHYNSGIQLINEPFNDRYTQHISVTDGRENM
jgi:hypothetical protein